MISGRELVSRFLRPRQIESTPSVEDFNVDELVGAYLIRTHLEDGSAALIVVHHSTNRV